MSYAISIATIPGRETGLRRCMANLPKDIPIYLYAAKKFKDRYLDLALVEQSIPNNCQLQLTNDTTSIRKLSYILQEDYEYIIQLDDDAQYTTQAIEQLIQGIKDNPGYSICFRGKILQEGLSYYKTPVIEGAYRGRRDRVVYAPEGMIVDMFIGVWGAIHRTDYFDRDLLLRTSAMYPTADDVVISSHLRRQGVLIKVVALHKEPKPLKERYNNALCKYNEQTGKTDAAIRDLFFT